MEEEQDEDEDALRGGADGEQDLRRRGAPAHKECAESVGGGEGEGGAEEGGEEGHQVAPLQQDGVDLAVFVGVRGGHGAGSGHYDGAEEFQQLGFGAIEVAVEQFAEGGAAHGVAGGFGGIDEGAAHLAARQFAFADQAVQHRHDGGVGQGGGERHYLLYGPHVAFLQ